MKWADITHQINTIADLKRRDIVVSNAGDFLYSVVSASKSRPTVVMTFRGSRIVLMKPWKLSPRENVLRRTK